MLQFAVQSQATLVAVIRKDGTHVVHFAPTCRAGMHGESFPKKAAQKKELRILIRRQAAFQSDN